MLSNLRGFGPCSEEGKMKYDEDWYYTPPQEPESEEDEDDDSYFQERAWEANRD